MTLDPQSQIDAQMTDERLTYTSAGLKHIDLLNTWALSTPIEITDQV
jgi:hypothetical protein